MNSSRVGVPAAVLLLAGSAVAVDGVLEINQACAVQVGCFTGDGAGFPVTLTDSIGKSVRLTSDLVVPDANTTAILIQSSHLSIDLNGFSIRGVTTCTEVTPSECSNTGTGVGIGTDPTIQPAPTGLELHSGSIIGMGSLGASLPAQAHVHDVRFRFNGGGGLALAFGGFLVERNTIRLNGGDGIFVTGGGLITGNVVSGNTDNGIEQFVPPIPLLQGVRISRNGIYFNTGTGLSLLADTAYENNTLAGNGATVSNGLDLGGNVCDGAAACP